MAELSDKMNQSDSTEKIGDEPDMNETSKNPKNIILSNREKKLTLETIDLNENEDQGERKKDIAIEEAASINGKRSIEQADIEKDSLHKSDSDSDEDSSKRQKLNECLPNTSTNDNPEECSSETPSNFRKLESKFKKRNYRSQSNSSDVVEDSSEPVRPEESIHEVSSSSESIDFEQDTREGFADSSDERSDNLEDNGDSNEWTTASEDDIDELPAVLQKEPSKSDWSIIKDVVNRQMGFNNSIQRRFYSSLHAVQRLELMYKLEEHLGCVNALSFNRRGNLLASASDDLTVTVWDWAIGKKRIALQTGHRSNVFQSKWLPLDMDSFVVTCARDGQVRLIDIRSSTTYKLAHHRAACHKISTHLNLPHMVFSAGEDSKVFSIDVRENKATKILSVTENEHEVELYSIHTNPLNDFEFCVAGRPRFVKIYDRRKPIIPLHQLCPKHLLSDKLAHVTCAVYNHNGTEVIASYNNEDIYLFDIAAPYQTGDFAHRYQGHRNSATVKGVNFFGPNSEFVLSGSDCGNIFIWDKKTEAIVQWMPGDEQGIVNALEPHPHIPVLATSGLDYDVKIWIPSREEAPNIKQQLQHCVKKNSIVLWTMLRHIRQAQSRTNLFAARLGNAILNNISDDEEDEYDTNDDDDTAGDDDSNETDVVIDDDDEDDEFNDNENNSDNSSTSMDNFSGSDNHSES